MLFSEMKTERKQHLTAEAIQLAVARLNGSYTLLDISFSNTTETVYAVIYNNSNNTLTNLRVSGHGSRKLKTRQRLMVDYPTPELLVDGIVEYVEKAKSTVRIKQQTVDTLLWLVMRRGRLMYRDGHILLRHSDGFLHRVTDDTINAEFNKLVEMNMLYFDSGDDLREILMSHKTIDLMVHALINRQRRSGDVSSLDIKNKPTATNRAKSTNPTKRNKMIAIVSNGKQYETIMVGRKWRNTIRIGDIVNYADFNLGMKHTAQVRRLTRLAKSNVYKYKPTGYVVYNKTRGQVEKYRNATESKMLDAVRCKPSTIQYMTLVPESVKFEAVKLNRQSIAYIRHQRGYVFKKLILTYPDAVAYLETLDLDLQLALIEQDPTNLKYIKHPDADVKRRARQLDHSDTQFLAD